MPSRERDDVSSYFLDRHVAMGSGGTNAILSGHMSLTYDQLRRRSWQLAHALREAGVSRGDRVLLILRDSSDHVAAIFGTIRLGAVAVPVSPFLSLQDYLDIIAACEPTIVIVDNDNPQLVQQLLGWKLACHIATAPSSSHDERVYPLFERSSSMPDDGVPTLASLDWPALIQFTSGSTGRPKGVVHRHQGILSIRETIGLHLSLYSTDICYSTAKLTFGYGFGNSLLLPFSSGATAILDGRKVSISIITESLKAYKPSIFFSVPGVYASLLRIAANELLPCIASIRRFISAGEHLHRELFASWKRLTGRELLDGIGSTECLHIFIASPVSKAIPGSTGRLLPQCLGQLRNEEGQQMASGEVGELWIKSPCNAREYWKSNDLTSQTMRDGWVRTGDLFYADNNGYYYYKGRRDHLVNVGGLKVAPIEVEQCLTSHPWVRECCVISVDTHNHVAKLVAFAILEPGYSTKLGTGVMLKEFLGTQLASYKIPATIVFVAQFPTTQSGKIDRTQLMSFLT